MKPFIAKPVQVDKYLDNDILCETIVGVKPLEATIPTKKTSIVCCLVGLNDTNNEK